MDRTGGRRIATLATAIGAFAAAVALDSNGFIAAFVAGIAFGATLDHEVADIESAGELSELGGELLALVVWFLFGATLVPVALDHLDGPVVVYALLSLTIVRMLPVALCMVGAGVDRSSVLFMAWFGPRGLASVVFALLAVEELGETSPLVGDAVGVVALTVASSVILHGITSGRPGRRFVARDQATTGPTSGPDRTANRLRRQQSRLRPRHANRRAVSRSWLRGSGLRRGGCEGPQNRGAMLSRGGHIERAAVGELEGGNDGLLTDAVKVRLFLGPRRP